MKFCSDRKPPSVPRRIVLFSLIVVLITAAIAAFLILNPFSRGFAPNTAQSTVTLSMYDANGVLLASGSGYAAFDKDIIITNYHCIEGNVYSIEAQRKDDSTFQIDSIVVYDEKNDIAVLRAPDCGLTPLKKRHIRAAEKDIDYPVSMEAAQAVYDSRTPEQELAVTAWYKQNRYTQTIDYILANAGTLHKQTVTVEGYISGMDADIYLVSSSDRVAFLDARTDFTLATATKLRELRSSGEALQVDIQSNRIKSKDLVPGNAVTVEGTVMYYSASDIRLIANAISKSK